MGDEVEGIDGEALAARLERGDVVLVAYCRGPFCACAHEAVRRLIAAGRPARRLDAGWPEWKLEATRREERAA